MVRRIVAPALAAVMLASAAAAPAGARSGDQMRAVRAARPGTGEGAMRVLEAQVLVDVNRVRIQHGLARLRFSSYLTAAAIQHSREMARRGYFSHDSANGASFWRRVERFYPSAGFSSWTVGENLLWSSPEVDSAGAIRMWMNSPEHRANLLNKAWREVGLAAVHVASAPGVYKGLGVTIVTADFGSRTK
jgi:uncharacterized protein YkwD